MTESQWQTSGDPVAMLAYVRPWASERNLLLLAAHCLGLRDDGDYSSGDPEPFLLGEREIGKEQLFDETAAICAHSQADAPALIREIFGNPFRTPFLKNTAVPGCKLFRDVEDPTTKIKRWEPVVWLTSDAVFAAENIYNHDFFDDMPILADALTEAGCTNEDILQHCRGFERCPKVCRPNADAGGSPLVCDCNEGWILLRGDHARGCWVLDLVLGKI